MDDHTLYILGGGPAGLSTAYFAKKNNIKFKLYEASNEIGGNCRTLKIDSFKFDTGAHRFHDKIPCVTKEIKKILGQNLLKVTAPSQIWWNNNFINFPLQIIDAFKILDNKTIIKIIKELTYNQFFNKKKYVHFQDFAYSRYGKTLSELFLLNYSEKLWGLKPNALSSDISGGRLKYLNISNMLRDLIFKQDNAKHLDGSFYYPKNGYGTIFKCMEKIINKNNINYNAPITKIVHDNFKIKKIISNHNMILNNNTDIISTLPLPTLIKILSPQPPDEVLNAINNLKYRSLKLCIIMINKNRISKNASIYFPDPDLPFTRLYEPKNRSEALAPKDQTAIVVEVPYTNNIMNDEKLTELIISELDNKNLFHHKEVISTKVITLPYAYPILEKGIGNKIKIVIEYLKNFKKLHLLGRNAHFKYLHTHDIIYQSKNKIKAIMKKSNI